ncbi:hypothetical protein OF83DRAFT_1136328 [Amylostereum chailletii]|nr:hypothetical protein OF83DRAFT_1136328 [Amylostereum chailletii]
MSLSAYLSLSGEGNETSDAANLSAEFIQAHMINNHTVNPLQFDMSSDPCAVTLDDQNGMMNIGLIIEGLSVWANQTSNATLSNIVNDLIVQSIKHTWTGSNGVITQGLSLSSVDESGDPEDDQSGAKAWFIRGLHEAWSRMSDKDSGPASLIAAYITVQFNALHNMSPNGDYSTNWTLPSTNASVTFDPWAQVVALDALNSAFDIATPATNSTSASPSSPSPPSTSGSSNLPDRSSTSHVGAIAGGTVGGGVAIAVVVGAAIFFFRRRKYRTVNKAPSSFFADRLVSPPSAALIDQVQDYGLSRVEKRGHEESDSTESSLGIAV